jgi:DNA-binding transcriptional MocR family regulator
MPLSTCYLGTPRHHGLILGYGGTTVAEIPKAIQRLRRVLRTN